MSIREKLSLLSLGLKVKWSNLCEFLTVVWRYYRHVDFAKTDLRLILSYAFQNPFVISRRFEQKRGADEVHTYGETPLSSLEALVEAADIKQSDTVIELGCGRGRPCFWLHYFVGCKVVGVDIVPKFIEKAKALAPPGVRFRLEDICTTSLEGVSVVYLYGICYDDEFLRKLAENLETLKPGARVITASFPITDYCEDDLFKVTRVVPVSYTWGEADVYVQERI